MNCWERSRWINTGSEVNSHFRLAKAASTSWCQWNLSGFWYWPLLHCSYLLWVWADLALSTINPPKKFNNLFIPSARNSIRSCLFSISSPASNFLCKSYWLNRCLCGVFNIHVLDLHAHHRQQNGLAIKQYLNETKLSKHSLVVVLILRRWNILFCVIKHFATKKQRSLYGFYRRKTSVRSTRCLPLGRTTSTLEVEGGQIPSEN